MCFLSTWSWIQNAIEYWSKTDPSPKTGKKDMILICTTVYKLFQNKTFLLFPLQNIENKYNYNAGKWDFYVLFLWQYFLYKFLIRGNSFSSFGNTQNWLNQKVATSLPVVRDFVYFSSVLQI